MDQIKCPVCTLLNPRSNTNCDVCDSPLVEGTTTNNPLEDQFMQLTGESRSKAQEYLKVTRDDLDKAVGLFYQDQEMGVTNQQVMNDQQMFNNLLRSLTSSLRQSVQSPKNIEELVCQTLYRRGSNTPHHCAMCDSKAFLICTKMLSYKDSVHDIIKFMAREDLELMKITEDKYPSLVTDILSIVNEKYIPLIIDKLKDHVKCAYENREKLLKEGADIEIVENTMNSFNGLNFRIIWDILHSKENKIEEETIIKELNNLTKSEEFHSYLNQSWESPEYNHPASKEVVSSLKKLTLEKDSKELEELKDQKCAVCMEKFSEGKDVTSLGCHTFCTTCINQWLENHNDYCPICRKKVEVNV
jgi:hypothetical protein